MLVFIILRFRFALTSQFYRHIENTFQSILYNEVDLLFHGNNRKVRFADSFRLYGICVILYSCWPFA